MKGKLRVSRQEEFLPSSYTYESVESALVNRPLKSPSPDKKSANIIVSTRSPDIQQLKRSTTPTREETAHMRSSQRSEVREKNFQLIITPGQRKQAATFKNVEPTAFRTADSGTQRRDSTAQHPSPNNSRSRNIKIEIAAEDQLEVRHSGSRYRSQFRSELSELDYLRILKTKEETISELKDYISSIETRAPEDSYSNVRNYDQRVAALNSEIKELKIENQHLFNAMEKEKERARSAHTSREREEIIQREIRELRETLRIREGEGEQLARILQKQRHERREIEQENDRLLRLLKDRGLREQPYQRRQDNTSLSGSSLSQQRNNSDKDRLSLIKIKELHQENLKIAKESFYIQLRGVEQSFVGQMEDLHAHVEHLNSRIAQLQLSKRQAVGKLASREQAHRQSERHQQIQAVLLDKHSNYERLLQEQRRENEELRKENQKLSNDLTAAHKEIEELHGRSLTYSREVSYLPQEQQQLVENLRNENQKLTIAVQRLQKQLTDAELQLDAAAQTARQQQHKLVVIVDTYQTKIKEERSEREQREHQLKQMQERQKAEIEQQLKDALKLYDKENSGLKQSLLQKNNDILNLNQQLQKLKADLHQHRLNNRRDSQDLTALTDQNNQLKNRNIVLQKNVELLTQQLGQAANRESSLNTRNAETESRLRQAQKLNEVLKVQVDKLQKERQQLNRALNQAQNKINDNEEAQVEILGRFRGELDAKDAEMTLLNSKLMTSSHRIDQLEREKLQLRVILQNLRTERSSINFATIQQELKELRAMITDYYSKNKNRLENEIFQDYFRLVHTHELKIDQNLKLSKQIDQLRGQLSADNRQKLLLSEKISLLQSNIAIYQRQLRERRHLYEQVLQQKVRIEKEALLSKRIKTEQVNLVEGFKSGTADITTKIDRLVDFQRERYRQLRALVEQHNGTV